MKMLWLHLTSFGTGHSALQGLVWLREDSKQLCKIIYLFGSGKRRKIKAFALQKFVINPA